MRAFLIAFTLLWWPLAIEGDATLKSELYAAQDGFCLGCEIPFLMRNLEVDHIHPQSKGGDDSADNLQLLCSFCNRVKGDRTMNYLKQRLATVHLVRPSELAEHVKRTCQLATP